MPNPKNVKATGVKKSGYSNTSKSNNTTYVSSKDKLFSKTSALISQSLDIYDFYQYLKSDFNKLKKYLPKSPK